MQVHPVLSLLRVKLQRMHPVLLEPTTPLPEFPPGAHAHLLVLGSPTVAVPVPTHPDRLAHPLRK